MLQKIKKNLETDKYERLICEIKHRKRGNASLNCMIMIQQARTRVENILQCLQKISRSGNVRILEINDTSKKIREALIWENETKLNSFEWCIGMRNNSGQRNRFSSVMTMPILRDVTH